MGKSKKSYLSLKKEKKGEKSKGTREDCFAAFV